MMIEEEEEGEKEEGGEEDRLNPFFPFLFIDALTWYYPILR